MKNKYLAVVQARMGSSRLPNKSLKRIGPWTLIEMVLRRVNKSKYVNQPILATTKKQEDDILAEYTSNLGFKYYRGSTNDVLRRFFEASVPFNPFAIVRITGDCPLISPVLIDNAIEVFEQKDVDYLTLSIGEDKEYAYPRGFDVEIVTLKALKQALKKAEKPYEREHVMPYFYGNPDKFKIYTHYPDKNISRPKYRLCIDTQEDFEFMLEMFKEFSENLISTNYIKIIKFLDKNPDIVSINQKIKQKHFTRFDERWIKRLK